MASFGESLKRERELREISLRQISEATKINLRYLEALEENRFDALPGGLFNKGFIRAYATYIGIDGEAMVNSYLQEINAHRPGGEASSRGPSNLHRPQEVPQRRAAAGDRAERAPSSAMSTAQRRAQETRASAIPEPNHPAHAPSQGETRATLAALERVLDQTPERCPGRGARRSVRGRAKRRRPERPPVRLHNRPRRPTARVASRTARSSFLKSPRSRLSCWALAARRRRRPRPRASRPRHRPGRRHRNRLRSLLPSLPPATNGP